MTRPRRRLLVAVAVVVAGVGGYFAFRPAGGSGGGSARAEIGSKAPGFSTFDLDGESVRLADALDDGPVLVNFWASWCVPCRDEFPMLARVHGQGVTVLGVIFRDEPENARAFMKSQRAEWPGLLDPQGRIAAAYSVAQRPGIPVTYAIDADGVIRVKHLGPLTQSDLDRLVTAIRTPQPSP